MNQSDSLFSTYQTANLPIIWRKSFRQSVSNDIGHAYTNCVVRVVIGDNNGKQKWHGN